MIENIGWAELLRSFGMQTSAGIKYVGLEIHMKRPFMLAQVALIAYATVFVLIVILLLLPLSNLSSSTPPIGIFVFVASLIVIIVCLLSVSKALSKGKRWAQVCAYIIFIGFGVLAVPLLILCVAEKEPTDDFWDVPAMWPALWVTIMLCIGIISLIFQRPKKEKNG